MSYTPISTSVDCQYLAMNMIEHMVLKKPTTQFNLIIVLFAL